MENEIQENIDSTNDELENADSTNEQNFEEATDEESSEKSDDDSKEESEESGFTENEKKLYARAKKAEKELKKYKGKGDKSPEKDSSKEEVNDALLSRLEARQVFEKEDQDYVIRFAKSEGIHPIDALSDPIVQDRLKANERNRKSSDATPRSNNRTGNAANEVDAAYRKYKKDGTLPDNNPALTMKVLRKLKEEEA